jgi:hypothetical protein
LWGLAVAYPWRVECDHAWRRRTNLGLTALATAANITSLVLLGHEQPAMDRPTAES